MRVKKKTQASKVLMLLAGLSFCIAMAESFFFYDSCENGFFRFLLMLQNSMKAFVFNASISIESMLDSVSQNPSPVKTAVGYAYGFAVFTAPFCSAAAVYKCLERALRLVFWLKRRDGRGAAVIFGYNEDVRELLDHYDREYGRAGEKRAIHLVSSKELPSEERYTYLKQGYHIHEVDCLNSSDKELSAFFRQFESKKISRIVLFSESTVENFSLLQIICPQENDVSWHIADGAEVFFRCEDAGIRYMVEDYYDHHPKRERFDLDFVSIPEMQIRDMYREHSLHSYYENSGENSGGPGEWATHLLILGFGQLGQQALLQAMNLSVVSCENPVRVDVVDCRIDEKAGVFASRFSPESMEMADDHFAVRQACADGSLDIYFHKMDVRYGAFPRLLQKIGKDMPLTYAVITLEDLDVSMHCTTELQRYLTQCGQSGTPIMVRMDSNARLGSYIRDNGKTFRAVQLIKDRKSVLTLRDLFDEDIGREAKAFNQYYAAITMAGEKETAKKQAERTAEEACRSLNFFRRDSNRGAAYHSRVDNLSLKRLAMQTDDVAELGRILENRFGPEGTLMKKVDGVWRYPDSDESLLEKLRSDAFALEAVRTEHRRWCYYMISAGWKCGDKSDMLRQNPSLVGWEALAEMQPDVCKYDLMPLIVAYERSKKGA